MSTLSNIALHLQPRFNLLLIITLVVSGTCVFYKQVSCLEEISFMFFSEFTWTAHNVSLRAEIVSRILKRRVQAS